MPSRIPRACRKRGCVGTTTDSSGYCDKHRGEGWVQHQRGLSRTSVAMARNGMPYVRAY